MEDTSKSNIEFRLTNIEETLKELKELVVETKMQGKDITTLQNKQTELEKQITELKDVLIKIENRPIKEKADKWQYIMDYIFKFVVAGFVAYLFLGGAG